MVRSSDRADAQANGALALAKQLGRNPRELAQAVVDTGLLAQVCSAAEVAGSSDTIDVCPKIGGTTAAEKNTLNLAANLGIIVGSSGAAGGHTFNLPTYAGGASATNINTFLQNNNTGSFTTDAYADAPATLAAFTGSGTTCPTP